MERFIEQVPLELFVFVGCFLEEVFSPIPSFVVLIPAGAAALVQGISWWYLPVLALIGASGRVLGSLILYFIADKSEDWLFGGGRRWFGVSHKQIESVGRRFSGSGRDFLALYLLNAVPVLPTSLLSLTCGFIKINLRTFVIATFLGSATNALFYMSLGYVGFTAAAQLRELDVALQIAAGAIIIVLVAWILYRKNKKRKGRT